MTITEFIVEEAWLGHAVTIRLCQKTRSLVLQIERGATASDPVAHCQLDLDYLAEQGDAAIVHHLEGLRETIARRDDFRKMPAHKMQIGGE